MIGPVILIVIGLLISKQELRLITGQAGLVTTAFQTGTLAFTDVMATGLVAGLCWVYARLLSPAGAENRKAARIPSTSLHISRTEDWETAARVNSARTATASFGDNSVNMKILMLTLLT
jgi:hypothetical protein